MNCNANANFSVPNKPSSSLDIFMWQSQKVLTKTKIIKQRTTYQVPPTQNGSLFLPYSPYLKVDNVSSWLMSAGLNAAICKSLIIG